MNAVSCGGESCEQQMYLADFVGKLLQTQSKWLYCNRSQQHLVCMLALQLSHTPTSASINVLAKCTQMKRFPMLLLLQLEECLCKVTGLPHGYTICSKAQLISF